jgi:hypothetical protein
MTKAEVAVWAPYQARPGRRVLVATNLAVLHGPVHGTVVLPLRLYWSPAGRVFDLDDPYMLRTVYEVVLQESIHADELATWLNGNKLAAVAASQGRAPGVGGLPPAAPCPGSGVRPID